MPIIESRNDDARPDEPKARAVVTPEMEEAGFRVLSQSGIADGYSGADRLLVAEIYRAMFAFDLRTSGTQHLTEETNKSR